VKPSLWIFSLILLTATVSAGETYVFERMWPTLQQPWYFDRPGDVAVDSNGYIYVADFDKWRIAKLAPDGQFITEWRNGGSEDSQYLFATSIAIDNNDKVCVVDSENNRVQVYSTTGQFITEWGSEGSGDGEFSRPAGIAVDSSGNVYVMDRGNRRVQKFGSSGQFITKWGSEGEGDGQFKFDYDNYHTQGPIAVDSNGNVYVGDTSNHRIQKFTSDGQFLTKWGSDGSSDGEFQNISGLEVDASGNVYVADAWNDTISIFSNNGDFIRKWQAGGISISGLAMIGVDQILVTDIQQNEITKFTLNGVVVSTWGSGSSDIGKFYRPTGITVDNLGNIYVADTNNDRIQKFDANGLFVRMWSAERPAGITMSSNGDLYVASFYDHVSRFTSDGELVTRWGSSGSGEGEFNGPYDVAVDYSGNVYVAEEANHRIQKFTSNGQYLKSWGTLGTGDGQFGDPNGPTGIAVDTQGNVYASDPHNNRIQKFTSNGEFITQWGTQGSGAGEFNAPYDVSIDGSGNIYVADMGNDRIQKLSSTGTFVTEWGGFGIDPGQMFAPLSVHVSSDGTKVYVVENSHSRIQVFTTGDTNGGDSGGGGSDGGDGDGTTTTVSKAIIVAGGGPFTGNNIWDATSMCANYAYRALTYQGYTKDTIYYLSADTDLDLDGNGIADDVDADATNSNFQNGITSWAQDANDLFIYMVDHGGQYTFRMGSTELLQASDLDDWLDDIQDTIPGEVTLVYDACRSGSFLSLLDPPTGKERIIATSTAANEEAIFGSQGTISFSYLFWGRMFNGDSFYNSFVNATNSLGVTYHQSPQLEGNGNGIGNERADQEAARLVKIGNETRTGGDIPVIGSVSPEQTLDSGSSAVIYAADVIDADGISRVWAVITPPGYASSSPDVPVTDLPTLDLNSVGNNRYEATYTNFTTAGTYNIAVYAADRGGVISMSKSTKVTVPGSGGATEPYPVWVTALTTTATGNLQAGDSVTFITSGLNSEQGSISYKFFCHPDYGTPQYDSLDNNWVTMQEFSATSSCTYTFSDAGNHVVVAWAVSDPSNIPAALPIIGTTLAVGNEAESVNFSGLTTNITSIPQVDDSIIYIANAVSSSGGQLYYKFFYHPDYGTADYDSLDDNWVTMQEFSTSNSCTYSFSTAGSYVVVVWVVFDPNNLPDPVPLIGATISVSSP
jgi:DNA-binding beta-propeller fold protein YncE